MPWDVHVDARLSEEQIERLALFLVDLRPFWPIVSRLWIGWTSRQFDTEGGFAGRPWAPLSPAYAAWKRANYGEKKILVRTGALKRAATTPQRLALPRSLTLTIEDRTAGWHQEGTPTMPARPIVFSELPPTARAELDDAAEGYVRDLLGRI